VQSQGDEVAVAEAFSALGSGGSVRLRVGVLAGHQLAHGEGEKEVPPFCAVGAVPLDQPLAAAEPARGARLLAQDRQVYAEVEGAARCLAEIVLLEVRVMAALDPLEENVHAADHVRGRRQADEVLGTELVRVGVRKPLVRIAPGALCERRSAEFDFACHYQERPYDVLRGVTSMRRSRAPTRCFIPGTRRRCATSTVTRRQPSALGGCTVTRGGMGVGAKRRIGRRRP
jgi:hypothetical protein